MRESPGHIPTGVVISRVLRHLHSTLQSLPSSGCAVAAVSDLTWNHHFYPPTHYLLESQSQALVFLTQHLYIILFSHLLSHIIRPNLSRESRSKARGGRRYTSILNRPRSFTILPPFEPRSRAKSRRSQRLVLSKAVVLCTRFQARNEPIHCVLRRRT
jgi:hypothetical protein